ncbi:hypothetical protein GCM10023093_07250 [Nemorincola caseinilytica]|uniref:PepSY domain-containing protein n=1 Tax=Nemorincola caseinilytica TaxID=2054315 RepID=A0ABP8N8K4_9BACT
MARKRRAPSGERMKAAAEEFLRWLPKDLEKIKADGESVPFYLHIDLKTGEVISRLYGQEALDATKESDGNPE